MAGLAVFDKDIHNAVSQTLQGDILTAVMMLVEMDRRPLMVL